MELELVLQLLKNGVVLGLLYGLIAYGLSMALAATGVFHLAHVTTLAAGAYGLWWLLDHSVWVPVAVLGACLFAGLIGLLVELLVYGPLRKAGAGDLVLMVASLTVLTLGQGILALVFGSDSKVIPPSDFMAWRVDVAGVAIRAWDLLVLSASVVVFLVLYLIQRYTVLGLSFRALGDNPELARTRGIRVRRMYAVVLVIASLVAGLAGALLAVQTSARPTMGFDLLIMAVVVLVVGGVGSMIGALAAGVGIGVVESLLAYATSSSVSHIAIFVLLFVLIYLRPTGIRSSTVRTA